MPPSPDDEVRAGVQRVIEHRPPQLAVGPIERACRWISELAIGGMIVMVVSEVFLRNLLGVSLQSADELGGYLLVGVSFLSLSTCLASGAYHKVELIDARLSKRGHAARLLIFDALSLGFCLILLWQFLRLVLRTWDSGDAAATILGTPLWIPQLTMPLGVAALCYSLIKSLRVDIYRLRAGGGRSHRR
jgi:TRAP-type C4-dicarboxylate transport system permease small subunit